MPLRLSRSRLIPPLPASLYAQETAASTCIASAPVTPPCSSWSGIPRFSFHYNLVQSDLAKTTRVCAYDKAGEAWTDPVPEFTAEGLLAELDAVVRHVSRSKPVILVGHSFGGILARAYYGTHPDRVRGLVLVDTPHPDMIRMPVNGVPKKMYDLTDADMEAVAEMGRKEQHEADAA